MFRLGNMDYKLALFFEEGFSSLPGTRMRCCQKTGRSCGCFSPSSPGSPRSRERSWLRSIPGSHSTLSHRRSTHRWESPVTHMDLSHLSSHLSTGLNLSLCLTGLCKLQRRYRGRPLPSPACPRQLVPSGESSGWIHRTCGGHLRNSETKRTNHPAHSKPAQPETSSTGPGPEEQSKSDGRFYCHYLSLMWLPLLDHEYYTSLLFVLRDPCRGSVCI